LSKSGKTPSSHDNKNAGAIIDKDSSNSTDEKKGVTKSKSKTSSDKKSPITKKGSKKTKVVQNDDQHYA